MAKKPRENRVPIMMSEEELTAIDDWRFTTRVATRSEAVRRLCKIALVLDETGPKVRLQTDAVLNAAINISDFILESDLAGLSDEDRETLKRGGRELFEAVYNLFDAQIAEILQVGGLGSGLGDFQHDLDSADRWRDFVREESPLKRLSDSPDARALLKIKVDEARHKKLLEDSPDNPRRRPPSK